ncbi:MAG TPA: HD domain-containing protein [Candidatus Ozemobacteraceae bacterium]|nr:HD domain-containing protein [Candidatus Ozemobacteraceae bacterium]
MNNMISASTGLQEFDVVVRALGFAAVKHSKQRRKDADKTPYINHPIALLELLWTVGGIRDAAALAAALLHDTVEDTGTTPEELSDAFGEDIRDIVLELSSDKSLPSAEQKRLQVEHAPHMSPRAKLVKLCDKICNVTDIHVSPPAAWEPARKLAYFDWAGKVVDGVRGINPALEARFDEIIVRARAGVTSG